MNDKVLVIVESPTKARTIRRFLPKNFEVEASIGHVRDLPQSASDIPKSVKGEDWARLGINVEDDFKPLYITPKGKSKIITELRRKMKEAGSVYLATDEDREGESISWHLVQLLKPKVPVKRMVFHEITRNAIEEAIQNPRDIDMQLVKAQETRRILDRLYGYTLSPLIWKKIAYGLSAGRVQSPGLRMIVERERERIRFRKAEYWDLKAELRKSSAGTGAGADDTSPRNGTFEARLTAVAGTRVAGGKDFDESTGKVIEGRDVRVLDEAETKRLTEQLRSVDWGVDAVTEKQSVSRPAAPFITSTLQQEANRKLGLTAREAMRTAQRLYEEGLITYMRTDSPQLSSEAIAAARAGVERDYGKEYLSPEPRQFSSKSGSAQEAHEAIRPAGSEFRRPDETGLEGKEKALYELIWKRTMASQMAEAKKSSLNVRIQAGDCTFTANGTRILFPGFLRVYVEGSDDPEAAIEDREVLLPELREGDTLSPNSLIPLPHETKAPPRYTEASLVQRLEKEGIGRPSTYAGIISTILERGYIRKQGTQLVPTYTGMGVTQLLENHFEYLIKYGFTSDMETALDEIAVGERDYLEYLREFYLGEDGLKSTVEHRESKIKPEDSRTIRLPQLNNGTEVKIGRFGPYIVHNDTEGEAVHASIPEEIAPADLTEQDIQDLIELQKNGPSPIGHDPETELPVYCLVGRYGPYVQLGDKSDEDPKPKRASVPKELNPREITLEQALRLLSLPRTLGLHPESGKEVVAAAGRFGPYVMCDGEYRSLKKEDDVYSVDLDRALELLSEEKKGRGGRSKVLKDLGTEPTGKNRKIAVYDGKYGPYIKVGTKNVGLPENERDTESIENMTLERALEIIKASTRK